jgi:RES domain-containing protein
MHAHPDRESFRLVFQSLLPAASAFGGVLYRGCDPLYSNTQDLLTGQGSRKRGGRWNPPGGNATIYLSQSVHGAIAESLGLPRHYGFDPAKRLPLTLVAVDAVLEAVLDFTDAGVRKSRAW